MLLASQQTFKLNTEKGEVAPIAWHIFINV